MSRRLWFRALAQGPDAAATRLALEKVAALVTNPDLTKRASGLVKTIPASY